MIGYVDCQIVSNCDWYATRLHHEPTSYCVQKRKKQIENGGLDSVMVLFALVKIRFANLSNNNYSQIDPFQGLGLSLNAEQLSAPTTNQPNQATKQPNNQTSKQPTNQPRIPTTNSSPRRLNIGVLDQEHGCTWTMTMTITDKQCGTPNVKQMPYK